MPAYPVAEGRRSSRISGSRPLQGLEERLTKVRSAANPPPATDESYRSRLASELATICEMGFAGYFLIVADFIRWARENGVPVGPGRGSGAGSLAAFALRITDLDPLRYDLLFERFLNPERVSMPDFDIDFCMEGRDRVIDYVAERYGRDRYRRSSPYGTLAAKAVVRDVARVLGQNYGFADSIAKLIPFELGITLDEALRKEDELRRRYQTEDDVREVIDLARSLEGLVRNAGTHAGGVVIAPSVLTDFAPLYCEEGATSVVTQFDKDDVEAAGLVKFDFLGLRTLTIIDWAVRTINAARAAASEPPLDPSNLPVDDAATYALLKRCETTAIFQLESRGMRDLVRRLQPDRFEDIVALVALFRPGPLQSGMVDDFINRKHGRATGPIDYLHPDLEAVLAPTYGVILYQEQVMKIAQVLAGYTLGGADLLRRAMGKKKPEEMAKQRSVFVDGAVARGVAHHTAAHIFDLMEMFAGYGFNKSHSAAYALLSYQTAWLKAHYPAAFMAAVLSSDMDRTDKVVTLIDECRRMGLAVEGPDVNCSQFMFAVEGASIRYGLGAIKGVGQAAVECMLAERASGGAFSDLRDLCRRIDLNRVNRRVLEALIRSGALDALAANRATLMHELPAAMQAADQTSKAQAAGQSDLFGVATHADAGRSDRRSRERAAGGMERRVPSRRRARDARPVPDGSSDCRVRTRAQGGDQRSHRGPGGPRPVGAGEGGWRSAGRSVTVAGLVLEIRKRGGRTSLVLDDRSGRIEVTLFEDVLQQYRALIERDAILVVDGALRWDEFIEDWRLTAKRILDLDQAREQYARRLVLRWPGGRNGDAGTVVTALEQALRPSRGGRCAVGIRYNRADASAFVELGEEWTVRPSRELIERLGRILGRDGVELYYAPRVDG
jgi:DNA polymerase-3 subunit alpha